MPDLSSISQVAGLRQLDSEVDPLPTQLATPYVPSEYLQYPRRKRRIHADSRSNSKGVVRETKKRQFHDVIRDRADSAYGRC